MQEEVGILEIKEETEIQTNRAGKKKLAACVFFFAVHNADKCEVGNSNGKKEENEFGSAPAVKKNAESKDHIIAVFSFSDVIHQQKKRQKSPAK